MSFNGAVSKKGVGAGISIRSPNGEPKLFSYKLDFKCTNNVAKYEALILWLKALKDVQAQKINIQGDSELVIKQVQGSYQAKHPRLKSYRNLVLDLMVGFKECQYTVIPRSMNSEADALVVFASIFHVHEHPKDHFQIEVKYRPSILNNADHWQVLENDEQINRFLQMSGEFENLKIDQENMNDKKENIETEPTYLTQLAGKDIIQLKSNSFPRGLVPLEDIFYSNDVAKSPKVSPRDDKVEECKIGTKADLKVIKISKNLTKESREKHIKLIKEFHDVFSWTYDDLKVYDPDVIQHTICYHSDFSCSCLS